MTPSLRPRGGLPPTAPLRVVMAVASDIERDARVKKVALAVAAAGHEVELLFGRKDRNSPARSTLGPVRTIGLDVAYALRDAHEAGRWPGPPPVPIGAYRDPGELDLARLTSAVNTLRAADGPVRERAAAAREALVLRARAIRQERYEKARAAAEHRRELAAPTEPDWRGALPNVADLDMVFTRRLWRPDPDVIHIHDIHLLEAGVLAARRLRKRGRRVRLVYDAHEYVAGMANRNARITEAWAAMEGELIGEADVVITVSEPIADAIQSRYGLGRRPVVALNTPTLVDQRPAGTDVRREAGLGDDVPLVVYSGVLNPRRGVTTAVESLVHLPGVHLAIVCVPSASAPGAIAVRKQAEKIGVDDRVHLVEPVGTDEILDFLRTADLGVHPLIGGLLNHEMALPNKLFDYLYAGLPVVVSDVQLMGAFVRDRKLGATFTPQDPRDLARAVREVLDDAGAMRDRVTGEDLREEFAWETQAARIADVYASFTEPG